MRIKVFDFKRFAKRLWREWIKFLQKRSSAGWKSGTQTDSSWKAKRQRQDTCAFKINELKYLKKWKWKLKKTSVSLIKADKPTLATAWALRGSGVLQEPGGQRTGARGSRLLQQKKKKKKISPLFQTSRHSNPKSNAPSGSLSVKPADVFMMSTDEPLREIKVLFGGVRLHERREERRGERGDSDLSSHCWTHLTIKSIGKRRHYDRLSPVIALILRGGSKLLFMVDGSGEEKKKKAPGAKRTAAAAAAAAAAALYGPDPLRGCCEMAS